MFMIYFVLDNPDQLDDILAAWSTAGVRGVTISESTGMHRRHFAHVPMRYMFGSADEDTGNLTLTAIVENETLVHAALAAVEALVGNLDKPNTGVFAAWPLMLVKGLPSLAVG